MTTAGADSDEAIAAVARTGDRKAFAQLVERHKGTIYRFVRRYVGQSDDAYDVLQDCFIAAWQALARYDPSRPFLPWLRVIALNKCRDYGRRQRVRNLVMKTFALEPGPAPDTRETESESERLSQLDAAISRLNPFYKEPLLLTMVSGLSHSDAAAILKTTPKAVEMRIYRARKILLADMGENSPEG